LSLYLHLLNLKVFLAMKKFIFLFVIVFSVFTVEAQESDKPESLVSTHEIGLNVTQMLSALTGGNTSIDLVGPYFFTYKNIKSDGRAFRLGLGAEIERDGAPDSDNIINNSGFDIRLGYEKQWQLAPQWITYLGIDFLGAYHNIKSENEEIKTSSRTWNAGTGPVFGIQWMLSPQVGLSTETSLYYRHTEFIDQIEFLNTSSVFDDKDRSYTDNISFTLPTALFLSVRF